MPTIELVDADITRLHVDVIVNAANSSLIGGGGVDGAIHAAAGPELLEACRGLGGCPPGQAKLSLGYRLPARWVIHTVGPIWTGGEQAEEQVLRSCYRSSFELVPKGASSIAFPAISTGVYGYPAAEAARIAIDEVRRVEREPLRVLLVCFGARTRRAYEAALGDLPQR
jgi:O-acetyl-ADP-ribose deacetylase (regulator of RNase III)